MDFLACIKRRNGNNCKCRTTCKISETQQGFQNNLCFSNPSLLLDVFQKRKMRIRNTSTEEMRPRQTCPNMISSFAKRSWD